MADQNPLVRLDGVKVKDDPSLLLRPRTTGRTDRHLVSQPNGTSSAMCVPASNSNIITSIYVMLGMQGLERTDGGTFSLLT